MNKLFIDSETVVLKQLQADIEHTCIQRAQRRKETTLLGTIFL